MATYKILYWQEIPTQIKAEDEADDVTVMLDGKFMAQVDILAAKRGLQDCRRLPGPVEMERGRGARGFCAAKWRKQ